MFALYNRGCKIPVKKMEKNKLRLLVVEDEKKLYVGRLLMFKECLKYNIVPFMIEEDLKMFYYRGLKEWNNEKGYLMDACLTAQDRYKAYLDYFRISYS
jgi:hypothetical protein